MHHVLALLGDKRSGQRFESEAWKAQAGPDLGLSILTLIIWFCFSWGDRRLCCAEDMTTKVSRQKYIGKKMYVADTKFQG